MGVRASSAVMDIGTAMMVSNAILGALLARERQGEGQFVEVALFDTALVMTARTLVEREPNYSYVTARLLMDTLRAEVDNLFNAMHSDGRLSQLSTQWFGVDLTQAPK